MSAMPRPRSGVDRAAPRRVPVIDLPSGAAEFYGLVPRGPMRRKDLSKVAKLTLVGLSMLAMGSRTWVRATIAEVMIETGFSQKVVRQGLRELTSAGLIEWDDIGDQFRVLFRLRGRDESGPSEPSPRVAAAPTPIQTAVSNKFLPIWEPKREPDPEPKRSPEPPPHTPVLEREIRDDERPACAGEESSSSDGSPSKESDTTEDPVHEPDYHPTAPVDECVDQATEDELHRAIAARVMDIWGAVNRWMLREDIRDFGEAAVEYALTVCEEMPSPPRGQSYIRGILRRQHTEGIELGRRRTRSERYDPAASMQNYNPAPPPEPPPTADELALEVAAAIDQARSPDRVIAGLALGILRGMVVRGEVAAGAIPADLLADPPPGRKNPAAGSLAKVPPPPAQEQPGPSVTSYREQAFTARGATDDRAAHQAPGGSDPVPPPTGGASRAGTRTPPPPRGGGRAAGSVPASTGIPTPAGRPAAPIPAGAQAGDGRRPDGPRLLFDVLPVPSGVDSVAGAGRRQRQNDGPPEPHRRE